MDIDREDRERSARFSLKVWLKIIKYSKTARKQLGTLAVFIAVMSVIDVSFPLFQAWLIDGFIEEGSLRGIGYFAALYLSAIAAQTVLTIAVVRHCINFELDFSERIRNEIFGKFQELSVNYFNDLPVGYLVSKTMSDTERISNAVSWGILDIGWQAAYILGIFIPMYILSWKLALIFTALIPLALFVSVFFQRRLLRMNREVRSANSAVSAGLNEGIGGAKTSKTLGASARLNREFRGLTKNMYGLSSKYNRLSAAYTTLLFSLSGLITAAILSYTGVAAKSGMQIGTITAFLTYAFSVIYPIMGLSERITGFVASQANAERTLRILEQPSAVLDTPDVIEKYGDFFEAKTENWETMDGDVEFRNVSFRYSDDSRFILKNFDLKIQKGASVALVGETGAGKTTIVNLLCRFFEPTEGEILIDGRDYRERSQLWLQRNLGYVLQTPHLFSGTVRENIKYGRPDATDEEMLAAARAVSADKVVGKLKDGYDSSVGECGDTLSMGEKQLITFARAILADPKIIVLDEATSSIDTETEARIQRAIGEVLKGRTSVMIAHRLSTIKNADMIILIDDGGIAEQGTHKELMALKAGYYGLYTKLFETETADRVLG